MNSIFYVCALFLCVFAPTVNSNRERKINDILEVVRRIEEHITKENRLREVADIIRLEATVDKLGAKVDRVLNLLDNTISPSIGRSQSGNQAVVPRDLGNNIEAIQSRLENLELSVGGVEEALKKIDFDPTKMIEIERRTTQLKDDMNAKLRKIMNVLTALYEINKDLKSNTENKVSENKEEQRSEFSETNTDAMNFVVMNLEELEKKMTEQFSVLTSEIRSEVTSLKILTSSANTNCQNNDQEEEEWMTPENNNARMNRNPNARSLVTDGNALDNLVETLGRSTREIRQEIQQGIQGLETKLQNISVQTQSNCGDIYDTAESVISSRRIPFGIPVQSLDEDSRQPKVEPCTKNAQNVPNPKSCADLRKGGATCDGIYVIFPKGRRAVRVLCDMTTDGGGWTALMRRGDYGDKMTSFHRNWLSYKNGFGDTAGEFWIGNDVIHFMTSEEENMLRIHMSSFDGDQINLDYSSFSVGNESLHYRLNLGVPVGKGSTAANSLRYHNNHPFSTFDKKNDNFDQNCASTYKGGWWFNGCYFGFLNGEYFKIDDKRENWQGILWYDWKGNAALKGAEMLIRPKNFAA